MLYEFAHIIQTKAPFVWDTIEGINSFLFSLRYGGRLKNVAAILESFSKEYLIREAVVSDTSALVEFFAEQPKDAYTYFHPHEFDEKTIKKLIIRKSYLFFIVIEGEKIVGYYFLRCFFMGKCFRGKMVDYRWRNKGIAKIMGQSTMEIAQSLGLHMYGTISKNNPTSMASAAAVNDIRVIEELPDNNLYIEYLPKGVLKDKDL